MLSDIFRRFSSKTYLVVAFTGVSTTPVILFTLIQYSFLNSNIISLMENNHVAVVKNIADKLETYIDLNLRSVNYLSYQIKNKQPVQMTAVFKDFKSHYPEYKSIYFHDNKNNTYFYSNDNFKKTSDSFLRRYSLLESSKNTSKSFIVDNIEEPDKTKSIGMVSPIYSNGDYQGYLLACLSHNQIKKYIADSYLSDEKIIILNRVDNMPIYPDKYNVSLLSSRVLSQLKDKKSGVTQNYSETDKNEKAISFASIKQPDWIILHEYPVSDYKSGIKKAALRTFAAALISLAFAMIMGLWIAYYQHRFAKNILAAIREVAKGNYKKKVKSELILIPKEFHLMIKEFNTMEEKIEQLDSFKSNLIDTVSHEFRTPLTSIKGFSSTLLRKDVTFDIETQRKLLKIISAQSDRLSRMVEDLLVVPKLEGNVLKLNLQSLELEPIIEHISAFFPDDQFDIEINELIWVLVDSDRFEQVVLNLFENAHKYSANKESNIKIRATKEDNFAHIIVSNASERIAQEKLDSLFDKFVRLDSALTRTTGGTGLGLYITKGLVELMGGKIWLESAKEEFRVHFTVPLDIS